MFINIHIIFVYAYVNQKCVRVTKRYIHFMLQLLYLQYIQDVIQS